MSAMPLLVDPSSDVDLELCCKVASSPAEREGAYRLIYQSYVRAGLIRPNPYEMRVTPYNLLPTTEVFVATHHQEVICTVSLVRDGSLGLPMETIYPDEISLLREQGGILAEVSGLADRRRQIDRFFSMFLRLVGVLCPYAKQQGVTQLVVAVHPRHARFYQRFLKFEAFGEEKSYPEVCDHPAVPLCLDFAQLECRWPSVYELLFGAKLKPEELAPRTLLDSEAARLGAVLDWCARTKSNADSVLPTNQEQLFAGACA